MSRDAKDYQVTMTVKVMQCFQQSAAITQEESIDVAVEDFPGVAKVLNQFHKAFTTLRKVGRVK